jgi:ATP-dependent DNA helicase RecQ
MEKHLKDVYGFNKFRPYQKDIIQDILNGENVFAILPTGGGKSLLYQFPATFTNKITIVVSPLISLMNDQCKHLNSKNIKAVCLNSETTVGVSKYVNYKIIYTTPEFIITRIPAFKLIKDKIGLFAIDEAHCVSQWSHDFRHSYQKLGILQDHFGDIPLLAVTATATPRVIDEMYEFINIEEASEYSLGTRRTNLKITVQSKFHFSGCTFDEPTIVYVQTRKLCEKLSLNFTSRGIKSAFYHGGMTKEDKNRSHDLFINGEIMVIVATISFGMGIDKADIRHVINYGVPANIESYYQEIGRAGRDGINSKATIFYDDGDFTTTAFLISQSPDPEQIKIKMKGMETFRSYLQEKNMCRQQMIDHYFATGEFACEKDVINIPKCGMCDNCNRLHTLKMTDVSKEAICIVNTINENKMKNGYDFGLKKTIKNIQKSTANAIIPKKSDKWIKDVIDILVTKNVLKRYKAGFGFVIGIGDVRIKDALPIEGRIEDSVIKLKLNMTNHNSNADKLLSLMNLRNKVAKKYGLVPASFMNDRIVMNINDAQPKTISELWKVDGISNEFIMSSQCAEFMNEYVKFQHNSIDNTYLLEKTIYSVSDHSFTIVPVRKDTGIMKGKWQIRIKGDKVKGKCGFKTIYSDPDISIAKSKAAKFIGCSANDFICNNEIKINSNKKEKLSNRDKVFSLYKKNKSVKEIAKTLNLKPITIENHLFHILEFYEDVDIEPDYFDLSEEREEIIKKAILKVGTMYLRPIKDILPDDVTYAQIKLCILIMKIEGDFE